MFLRFFFLFFDFFSFFPTVSSSFFPFFSLWIMKESRLTKFLTFFSRLINICSQNTRDKVENICSHFCSILFIFVHFWTKLKKIPFICSTHLMDIHQTKQMHYEMRIKPRSIRSTYLYWFCSIFILVGNEIGVVAFIVAFLWILLKTTTNYAIIAVKILHEQKKMPSTEKKKLFTFRNGNLVDVFSCGFLFVQPTQILIPTSCLIHLFPFGDEFKSGCYKLSYYIFFFLSYTRFCSRWLLFCILFRLTISFSATIVTVNFSFNKRHNQTIVLQSVLKVFVTCFRIHYFFAFKNK